MCRSISPASFLALAFTESGKAKMTYAELEMCREKIISVKGEGGESFDVDWSHDAVRFTMGFYSPVFTEDEMDISCDLESLKKYFDHMVASLPQRDVDVLKKNIS